MLSETEEKGEAGPWLITFWYSVKPCVYRNSNTKFLPNSPDSRGVNCAQAVSSVVSCLVIMRSDRSDTGSKEFLYFLSCWVSVRGEHWSFSHALFWEGRDFVRCELEEALFSCSSQCCLRHICWQKSCDLRRETVQLSSRDCFIICVCVCVCNRRLVLLCYYTSFRDYSFALQISIENVEP